MTSLLQRVRSTWFLLPLLAGVFLVKNTFASSTSSTTVGPTVAIIGCGPSGMFFLHALATRRKELTEQGDHDALKALPQVTVFERSSVPGGVWKSNRGESGQNITNMYDGLWINAPKELLEFPDYTFDSHFKTQMPAYLTRKEILKYIMARVTQHEDIFEHVQFNTSVESASYDESVNQFVIKTQHSDGTTTTQYFDKCIWASGRNGYPKRIPELDAKLSKFQGPIIHSSEIGGVIDSVKGKRILMVGGSYSAEDLALQCIKLGAKEIYITTRTERDVINLTLYWPDDKVVVLEERVPCGVTDGNTVQFCDSPFVGGNEEEETEDVDTERKMEANVESVQKYTEGKEKVMDEFSNIDIIVMCTGYENNMDFLDEGLRGGFYRKLVLISNPNMMFLLDFDHLPLLEIDIRAWLAVAFITGTRVIPTKEQMMDDNDFIKSKHAREGYDFKASLKGLGRDMIEGNYPISFGTIYKLNAIGEHVEDMIDNIFNDRWLLGDDGSYNFWETYRDADPSNYSSYITGTKSIPLKGKWIELDDEGEPVSGVVDF